jgi:DNA-binding XRE family transcriptional regulator
MADKKQSKLAALREVCGLSQKELAALVNRSIFTIRALEQGRLALSIELAIEIAAATKVSSRWLLDNSPAPPSIPDPPVDGKGNILRREGFEAHRAALATGSEELSREMMLDMLVTVQGTAADLMMVILKTNNAKSALVAIHRLTNFLAQLADEFVPPDMLSQLESSGPLNPFARISRISAKAAESSRKRP